MINEFEPPHWYREFTDKEVEKLRSYDILLLEALTPPISLITFYCIMSDFYRVLLGKDRDFAVIFLAPNGSAQRVADEVDGDIEWVEHMFEHYSIDLYDWFDRDKPQLVIGGSMAECLYEYGDGDFDMLFSGVGRDIWV